MITLKKDGLIQVTIEEFIIELGKDDSNNETIMTLTLTYIIDKDDRQLIDEALQKIAEPT